MVGFEIITHVENNCVFMEILTQTDSTSPLARLLYLTAFRLDSSKELITDLVCETLWFLKNQNLRQNFVESFPADLIHTNLYEVIAQQPQCH